MKDLLIKYFTKTMLYHLVTRREYGFVFEKVIYSVGYQFNLFKGALNKVLTVKHDHMKDSFKKYLTKSIFLSPCNQV